MSKLTLTFAHNPERDNYFSTVHNDNSVPPKSPQAAKYTDIVSVKDLYIPEINRTLQLYTRSNGKQFVIDVDVCHQIIE